MIAPRDNISCKKATVLMSKSMEQRLTLAENASLAGHLAVCKTCAFCFRQVKTIRKTLALYTDAIFHHPAGKHCRLSDEAKKRITKALSSES